MSLIILFLDIIEELMHFYEKKEPWKLTVTEMHKDFVQSHSQEKVSDESYRKILNSMNISFTKLGYD